MKTLADLKRALNIGRRLTLTHHWNVSRIGLKRQVVKIQSNGVWLKDPDNPDSKASCLDFPKASLLEITEKGFRIFNPGLRDLTEAEKEVLANEPRDPEQDEIDAMTDGSTMFWRRKRYYHEKGFDYLFIGNKDRGRDHNDPAKVLDSKVKGELALEYVLVL